MITINCHRKLQASSRTHPIDHFQKPNDMFTRLDPPVAWVFWGIVGHKTGVVGADVAAVGDAVYDACVDVPRFVGLPYNCHKAWGGWCILQGCG
jgi:hypothetical protein